jgi:two-component system LytT family response regulator
MKLSALIIDDEKPSRDYLFAILQENFSDIFVCGQAATKSQAVSLIQSLGPDILFLDMELDEGTGLDLLESFPKNNFEVIFITAYDDYAASAFRSSAVDYLLKPIDADELREAVNRVHERIYFKKLKEKHLELNKKEEWVKTNFIKIHTSDGTEMIPISDILYLQGINFYTNIVLVNKREIISTRHLKEYEDQLKSFRFYRVHNSFIINVNLMTRMNLKDVNEVILINDIAIKVSRRRKDEFIKFLED